MFEKTKIMRKLLMLLIFVGSTASLSVAQTTAFNYQGKLSDSGASQRTYQMRFELYDAVAGGTNPLFVTYNDKREVEGVKYDRLSVVFVNAFKEQQTQIEQQRVQIENLKKLVCRDHPRAAFCRDDSQARGAHR